MEPWQLGVMEAAGLITSGQLSPVALTESLLSRVTALDGDLDAWVTVDAEGALGAAQDVAGRLARGGPVGRMAGVPVGIKDVIDVAGLRTTASSRALADFTPEADAACVTLLRAADATVLGKLHTAEFAVADPPPTRNPWAAEHTPGGSSSGSAVAVAAGMVPAALGTQTGGSTLRPAAYNGIVGLKASYGLVSNRGVIAVAWSFDHVGILARSVADAAGVLGVIAGHDPLDLSSAPEAAGFILPALDARRPPTIGLIRTHFLEVCEPEVLAHTLEVAAKLEASGAQGREIVLPRSYGRIAATVQRIFRPETYASHRERYEQRGHLYGPKIAALIEEGRGMPAFEYVEAARERPSVVAELEAALAGVDIALTPATPAPAPRDRSTTGDAAFQVPWSYAGLPAVALPSGLNAWGLPLGVQLVGHRWADADLLRAAQWCEGVLGFGQHPPCWTEAGGVAS
jgi:aspartyl-tRNA(Asn)/glutamyl-tRNA(Gln) amidotransferase subunit A